MAGCQCQDNSCFHSITCCLQPWCLQPWHPEVEEKALVQFPFYPEEGIIYASWETKWDGACANISVFFSNDLSFNDVKRYGVMMSHGPRGPSWCHGYQRPYQRHPTCPKARSPSINSPVPVLWGGESELQWLPIGTHSFPLPHNIPQNHDPDNG